MTVPGIAKLEAELRVETVDLVDCGRLMVSSEENDAGWVEDLPAEEVQGDLNTDYSNPLFLLTTATSTL